MKVNNGLLRCLFLFSTVFMARCSTKTGVDVDDELPANEFNLGKAREEALKLSNLIYQRYEFWNEKTYPFFLYSSNMPDYAWDILKYKIAIKTLMKPKEGEDHTKESKGSQEDGSSNLEKDFLMIFGGSSVTAGHDNYFAESWPLVYERRMKPVFNALGVRLRVHNIAQGANNCLPSNFCYEAMGGFRADWIAWEQSYNCGKAVNIFELMARVAKWSDAVLYFAASGAFKPDQCRMSPDAVPWSSEKWTPEAAGLKEGERTYPTNETKGYEDAKLLKGEWWDHVYAEYKPSREDIRKFRQVLHEGYMASNSVGRFTGAMYPHYDGVAPHGFSVWGRGDLGDAMSFRGDCYEKGGLHWMTLDAAVYSKGAGANWHPPAGMHLLRGEILAYNYVHVTLDAIDMVETALKELGEGNDTPAKREEMVEGYLKKLQKLQKPMPEKPMFCSPDCDTKPLCYTNFEPQYNDARRLTNLVVGEHEGWSWVRKAGSATSMEKYGYLDYRPCYETAKDTTEGKSIAVKIEIKEGHNNFVKVCSFPMAKEGLRHSTFRLDLYKDPPCSDCDEEDKKKHVQKYSRDQEQRIQQLRRSMRSVHALRSLQEAEAGNVNTTQYRLPADLESLTLLSDRKYHGDECHLVSNIPVGQHVMVITTNKVDKSHAHSLSHVIQW